MSEQVRLYQKIYAEIIKLIESGDFPVGGRLPTERELAERFNVSRPTIREAIIALEATNKVSVKIGSGVYVLEQAGRRAGLDNEISPFEVLEARVLLEGESAALAARMITNEEVLALEAAFEKMEQEDHGNGEVDSAADREFHTIIADATHNRVLAQQIHSLWEIQENLQHIRQAHRAVCANEGARRIKEHKAILEAIKSHDAQRARVAMRHHFSNVLETMHASMEEQALEEARQKGSKLRERFSLGALEAADK